MYSTPQSLLVRLCTPLRPVGQTADDAAWSRFVDLYSPLLYHWATRLTPQEADALDLVQEVFLLLHQKLPEFRYKRDRSFRNWLYTVLCNCWRDRQRRMAPPAAVDPLLLANIPAADPWEQFTEADYQRYLIRRAMELMRTDFEPASWRAFWETIVQERAAAEVAGELQMSIAAVYKAASRVRQTLRRELEGLVT